MQAIQHGKGVSPGRGSAGVSEDSLLERIIAAEERQQSSSIEAPGGHAKKFPLFNR